MAYHAQEGKIDPNKEIRIPGVLTESEKRQLEASLSMTVCSVKA